MVMKTQLVSELRLYPVAFCSHNWFEVWQPNVEIIVHRCIYLTCREKFDEDLVKLISDDFNQVGFCWFSSHSALPFMEFCGHQQMQISSSANILGSKKIGITERLVYTIMLFTASSSWFPTKTGSPTKTKTKTTFLYFLILFLTSVYTCANMSEQQTRAFAHADFTRIRVVFPFCSRLTLNPSSPMTQYMKITGRCFPLERSQEQKDRYRTRAEKRRLSEFTSILYSIFPEQYDFVPSGVLLLNKG